MSAVTRRFSFSIVTASRPLKIVFGIRSSHNAPIALACSYCFPLSCLCRPQDRIGYILRGEPVAECWRCWLICANADEKVGELVDEGVLVANLQSRDPPVLHVDRKSTRLNSSDLGIS